MTGNDGRKGLLIFLSYFILATCEPISQLGHRGVPNAAEILFGSRPAKDITLGPRNRASAAAFVHNTNTSLDSPKNKTAYVLFVSPNVAGESLRSLFQNISIFQSQISNRNEIIFDALCFFFL